MRRSRKPSPRRLTAPLGWALSLALALSSPAALRADAVESYTKGLDAVKTGSWADVARFMEEAVADMPQANRRIRLYGMRFEPYIPHYFLGLARSQLGDCRGALRAWETSVSQGVIQENRSEYSTLQQGRGSCEERLNEAAVEEVEVVEEETAPVPQPQPEPPPPPEPEPPPPKPAPEPVPEPVVPAPVPEPVLPEPEPRPPPEPEPVLPEPAPAPEPVAAQPEPAPPEPAPPDPAPVSATPSPAGPPEALRTAARAYFDGDYWGVLGALSGQQLEDEDVAAQALLFRAAARYALYLLGGEEEEALAEEAREEVAFCRRLAPDLAPDPRAFSPRFIAFFERDE